MTAREKRPGQGASSVVLRDDAVNSEDTTDGGPSQANRLAFHPLADLFPLIEGREFEELVADIKVNGLHEDIVLFDGMILDGRNRYRACMAAGVHPTMHDADKWIANPAAFVISANIRRRHLTLAQKRELIEKLLKADAGQSNVLIAKTTGVTDKTVGSVRAALEATSEIPRLEKTLGADGKARKRPQSRTARRRARFDRMKENAARERAAVAPEDEGDSPEVIWRRGLLHRAEEAAGHALYEDWSQFTADSEVVAAAERAAEAWEKTAAYLRELQHARLRSDTDVEPTTHEVVAAVFEEWANTLSPPPETVVGDDFSGTLAARMRQGESTGAPDDPFEIPPMLDRTRGAA